MFGKLADRIFGYDVFLSYSWRDGGQYSRDLAEELTRLRFSVFLDTREYVAGTDLIPSTRRRVRMSRHFVLILRPNAGLSEWVEKEVAAFLPTGRPLIAIDVNQTWAALAADSYLQGALARRLRISETLPALDGTPTDSTVGELVRSFTGTRRETARLRLVTTVAAALLVLGVVATWQWLAAEERLRDSQVLTMRLLSNVPEFDKAADIADAASGDDARFRLARAVLGQHRSFPVRIGREAVDGGIRSLAYDPRSGLLLGLSDDRLLVIDGRTGDLQRQLDPGIAFERGAGRITATGEPATFLLRIEARSSSPAAVALCRPADTPTCRAITVADAGLDKLHWFAGSDAGVALRGSEVVGLKREGAVLRPAAVLAGDVTDISASSDGSTVALLKARGNDRLLVGVVVLKDEVPVLRLFENSLDGTKDTVFRVAGNGTVVKLASDDTLDVRRPDLAFDPTTRRIAYKPWLASVGAYRDLLLVEEPFDRKLDTAERIHVLDLGMGVDLVDPHAKDAKPIWTSAVDAGSGRRYLSGQSGRTVVVDMAAPRVTAATPPEPLRGPLAVDGSSIQARPQNVLDRHVWQLGQGALGFTRIDDYYPSVSVEGPDFSALIYQNLPFSGALSPSGRYLAISGDTVRILKVPPATERSPAALRALAQRSLTDETLVEWQPDAESEGTPDHFHWISDTAFITDNFHGHVVLWNVQDRSFGRIDLSGDAASHVSVRGKPLVSTASGTVWEIDRVGRPHLYAKLDDLVALFQLDRAERYFVGSMQNPQRTAFLARQGGRLHEVASIPTTTDVQDALLVGNRVYLLYRTSVRHYSAWFEDGAQQAEQGR